jgi:hypothetical protein
MLVKQTELPLMYKAVEVMLCRSCTGLRMIDNDCRHCLLFVDRTTWQTSDGLNFL